MSVTCFVFLQFKVGFSKAHYFQQKTPVFRPERLRGVSMNFNMKAYSDTRDLFEASHKGIIEGVPFADLPVLRTQILPILSVIFDLYFSKTWHLGISFHFLGINYLPKVFDFRSFRIGFHIFEANYGLNPIQSLEKNQQIVASAVPRKVMHFASDASSHLLL